MVRKIKNDISRRREEEEERRKLTIHQSDYPDG